MGMEIRQLSGDETAQRFAELETQARDRELAQSTGHHGSNRLFLCAVVSFVVCVVFALISSVIPASGFVLGLLLAVFALVAFVTSLVFVIIGLVHRFTKESVK